MSIREQIEIRRNRIVFMRREGQVFDDELAQIIINLPRWRFEKVKPEEGTYWYKRYRFYVGWYEITVIAAGQDRAKREAEHEKYWADYHKTKGA